MDKSNFSQDMPSLMSELLRIILHNGSKPFLKWQTNSYTVLKFLFSKKATKIDEIFTVDLTLCSKCQIDGEDFVNFCGLLRKHEL